VPKKLAWLFATQYAWERTLKLVEKVKRIAHKYDIQLNPVKPAILLPILDGASLEDDAELQDKWAALLSLFIPSPH
jgi:hypothetical protein